MRATERAAIRALIASFPILIVACDGGQLVEYRCPPDCELDGTDNSLRLTRQSTEKMRHAAWALLLPFTRQAEGLPAEPDWTSVTDIPTRPQPDGKRAALPFKLDSSRPRALREDRKLYEAAFFNRIAWEFVEKLPTTDQLERQFARELSLPPHSMAIKMFFYRVEPGAEVNVRLWDWNRVNVTGDTNLDDRNLGTQCVMLKPSSPNCIAASDSFYTVEVTKENTDVFTCGRNCTSDLQDGDQLIMVAMHIASKQTPEWLWATFWWRGALELSGDFWTCQDAQQPDSIKSLKRWQNYSMDATANFQLLKPQLQPGDDDLKCGNPPLLGGGVDTGDLANQQYLATYNPFVEADFENGLKSSCVNCHARASTARDSGDPPEFEDITSPSTREFEWHIRTDYLWSLSRGLIETHGPEVAP